MSDPASRRAARIAALDAAAAARARPGPPASPRPPEAVLAGQGSTLPTVDGLFRGAAGGAGAPGGASFGTTTKRPRGASDTPRGAPQGPLVASDGSIRGGLGDGHAGAPPGVQPAAPMDMTYAPFLAGRPLAAAVPALARPAPSGTNALAAVDALVHQLLASNPRGGDARVTADARLQDRPLMLDNPGAAFSVATARQQQRDSAHRAAAEAGKVVRPTSATARRRALRSAGKPAYDYGQMLAVHALWVAYVTDSLRAGGSRWDPRGQLQPPVVSPEALQRLCTLELAGADVRVASSPRTHDVGTRGIVARDGGAALRLVLPTGRAREVLKAGAVFEALVAGMLVTLNGDALKAPGARAAKAAKKQAGPPRPMRLE